MRPSLRSCLLLLTAALVLPACRDRSAKDGDNKEGGPNDGAVKVAFGDSSARDVALGPNDVRITSTDGAVVLMLIGDTVRMQLSDSLRNAVGAGIAADADSGGIGGMIARSVSSVVKGAMGFVVRVPATDIENLRYEDGHVRFDVRNSNANVKFSGNAGDKSVFAKPDAERFINAVKKKSAASVAM